MTALETMDEAVVLEQPASWEVYLKDSSVPFDERLDRWEQFVSQFDSPPCPLKHELPDGLYVRTIHVPAGTILVTQIHKKDNPFFVTKGRVTVISDNEGIKEYKAPFSGITKPGTRRLIFVHEDVEWTTVHPNPRNLTDLDELESEYVESKESSKMLRQQQQRLLAA